MIDQQVAGQGGDPGMEAALGRVEAAQVAVELDEDVLGQVFGVMGGGREAVAEAVYPALLRRHQLRPGRGIPIEAAPHQSGPVQLRRFGPPFDRRLPAHTPFSFWRRVRRGVQRGRSSASRIAPPVISLKALTLRPYSGMVQDERWRPDSWVVIRIGFRFGSIALRAHEQEYGRESRLGANAVRFLSATTPGNSVPATSPSHRAER